MTVSHDSSPTSRAGGMPYLCAATGVTGRKRSMLAGGAVLQYLKVSLH